MSALDQMVNYASILGLIPTWHPYIFRLRNWLAGKKGVCRAYVAEHQAKPKIEPVVGREDTNQAQGLDFLTKFYSKYTKEPNSFTSYHIIAGCNHNMIAGSDTTGITLSASLYYLLKPPDLRKLAD